MSFLLDPPLLIAAGILIERGLPANRRDVAEAATLGIFFGGSFGLYHNVPGLGVLWRPFRAHNGRDFMWNSGVFDVKTDEAGWPLHAAAGGIFATYPFFIKLGRRLGRMI
ncbi:hypothetical protein [Mycobacterium haemophilum]|uniref:Uncharacterized protein n=1 Tax=Mycobacterium haemophilum TaxID=29311 RepID=A0A0I9U7H0_9MYCO|nr:hypothetical protein [Mycobacterium haemophilum]AKN18279.1 hypothetical protein B586_19560 [Mycobacterium haemophilum DSM 44634]KLO33104.1 hypothetical protein ABH39_03325 [Mycobacterium haemophilum]KLO38059.1 hypothetical protein ABH38_05580 [Mycobacterium haemophilum]KLO44381.1 hypothetical protein ABH37_04475 [Mycobacterium haemophilum]KLO55286.1 hypothetical protein ABH36_08435 [Mycobacterium haemophilum]